MIALLLCGLIAGAFGAPHFDHFGQRHRHHQFFSDYPTRTHSYVNDNIFDTGSFWNDLNKELKTLDDILTDFTRHFPRSDSQEGANGNEYKITISLPGFDEKDIVVKAREGLLMIQANHKYSEGIERSYLDVRNLPNTVNVTGNWVFENGNLKITFPLKDGTVIKETETVPTTTEQPEVSETVRPIFQGSREEIETNNNEENQNVDIDIRRDDVDTELKTNEIPNRNTVEATTYPVDLKDEVEFVPVKY